MLKTFPVSSVTNFLFVTSYNNTSTPSFNVSSLSLLPFSSASIQATPEIEYLALVFCVLSGVGVGVGVFPPSIIFPFESTSITFVVFGCTNVFILIFSVVIDFIVYKVFEY